MEFTPSFPLPSYFCYSERVGQTGATGKTLQESIGINKSLFVLRQVIQGLSEPKESSNPAVIPYRDAKLTSLLKNSLGGNSYTIMIACLSPSDSNYTENLSTLGYASKAQSIVNKPVVNLDSRSQLICELRAEIADLKSQLRQMEKAFLSLKVRGNKQKMPLFHTIP